MADYYLDSSALVKRYVEEVGSAWLVQLLDPASGHEVFIAAVTPVEMIAAITRRARGGGIAAEDARYACSVFRSDLETSYQTVEVTSTVIARAMTLAETYALRGYDALQLAAALEVNALCVQSGIPPIVFLSADSDLNAAAHSEGMVVQNPTAHG